MCKRVDLVRYGARPLGRGVFLLAIVLVMSMALPSGALAAGDANEGTCPSSTESSPSFRTYLPDCRAYEMATPPYMEGFSAFPYAISPDGSAVLLKSVGLFAGTEDTEGLYELSRGASGWAASPLAPSAGEGLIKTTVEGGTGLAAASTDLTATLWELIPSGMYSDAVEDLKYSRGSTVAADLYRRDGLGHPVAVGPLAPSALSSEPLVYRGASSDLTNVVLDMHPFHGFETLLRGQRIFWPGDTSFLGEQVRSLYEYTGTGNAEPVLVGVSGGAGSKTLISQCGTELGGGENPGEGEAKADKYNAISADGGAVFFTAFAGGTPGVGTSTCENNSLRYKLAYQPPFECTFVSNECPEDASILTAIEARLGELVTQGVITSFAETKCSTEGCEGEVALAPGTGPPVNELYARIGGSKTLAISEPPLPLPGRACTGVCKEDENMENSQERSSAVFRGASADGSKVFFTTNQPLVNEDEDTTNDLYMAEIGCPGGASKCEPSQKQVTKLVQVSHDPTASQAAEVMGVARVSEDGSRVYFVAKGKLTSEPDPSLKPGHQEAEEGADNLYVYEEGHVRFVATLASADSEDWSVKDLRPVQATPDGRFLVFRSKAQLTADDSSTVTQLFRYDAQEEKLVRVSIGDEGFNNDGNTSVSANAPGIFSPPYLKSELPAEANRVAVSDEGTVFFASPDGLTPQAVNDAVICLYESGGACLLTGYANNVYEYRDGHVYLISDGQDVMMFHYEPSVLLFGADAKGNNVFFRTGDQLAPQDTNTQVDLYDARGGGGYPGPVSPGCAGEACRGPLSGAPSLPSLGGSAAQTGGDNLAPAPAPKAKPLTIAQKLSKALKACKKKPKRKRAACEKQARKRYAGKSTASTAKKSARGRM